MGGRTIKCIWHCFLVDTGWDRYLSLIQALAFGSACIWRRRACIDQKQVPYAYLISICVSSRGCPCYIIQQARDASVYVGLMLDHRLRCWPSIKPMMVDPNASFTPVRHLCSVVRHPSSVISRPLQSLPFTPIRLSRAVDTDFCVPTVLNRYSPGKLLTEALFVGNSLSTAHYHDLWSASVIRRALKSLPDRFWLTMDDGRRMTN